jgi:hypothetical protein
MEQPPKDTDKCTCKIVMQLITNLSQITAWRYMSQAKESLKKEKHQILTVKEFREYYGI